MSKKKTIEEFIEQAKKIHNNKYDYSKVDYINNHTKICIICPVHGEFWQTPNSHLRGVGCKKCGRVYTSKVLSKSEQFFNKANAAYGDKYDYSKSEYVNAHTKIVVTCNKHGDFLVTPHEHLRGNGGCNECKKESISKFRKLTTEKFIEKAKQIHGNKYDYSKSDYKGAFNEVCIICPKHGEFHQRANCHLNGEGCPKCKVSKLESEIMNFLDEKRINYRYDVRNIKWLNGLTIDFYLPDYNVAIECQGIQHFVPSDNKKSFFNEKKVCEVKRNDKIKKELCNKNGLKLYYYSNLGIQYPYEVFEDKNNLLKEIIKYEKKLD